MLVIDLLVTEKLEQCVEKNRFKIKYQEELTSYYLKDEDQSSLPAFCLLSR